MILFDDIVTNMINNKKIVSVVIELSVRGRKLNIFSFFYYVNIF